MRDRHDRRRPTRRLGVAASPRDRQARGERRQRGGEHDQPPGSTTTAVVGVGEDGGGGRLRRGRRGGCRPLGARTTTAAAAVVVVGGGGPLGAALDLAHHPPRLGSHDAIDRQPAIGLQQPHRRGGQRAKAPVDAGPAEAVAAAAQHPLHATHRHTGLAVHPRPLREHRGGRRREGRRRNRRDRDGKGDHDQGDQGSCPAARGDQLDSHCCSLQNVSTRRRADARHDEVHAPPAASQATQRMREETPKGLARPLLDTDKRRRPPTSRERRRERRPSGAPTPNAPTGSATAPPDPLPPAAPTPPPPALQGGAAGARGALLLLRADERPAAACEGCDRAAAGVVAAAASGRGAQAGRTGDADRRSSRARLPPSGCSRSRGPA